jgi:hypothetical protein
MGTGFEIGVVDNGLRRRRRRLFRLLSTSCSLASPYPLEIIVPTCARPYKERLYKVAWDRRDRSTVFDFSSCRAHDASRIRP